MQRRRYGEGKMMGDYDCSRLRLHPDNKSKKAMQQDGLSAADRIEDLEAENAELAAHQCCVDGGLVGDEYGHQYCTLKAENKRLRHLLDMRQDADAWREVVAADSLEQQRSK